MPFKDKEKSKEYSKQYYLDNKNNWKNSDGSWKKSNTSVERRREIVKNSYNKNKDSIILRNKEKRREKVEARGNHCVICDKIVTKLYYDHDHVTNEFRGFICIHCNLALGHVFENINTLHNMINYLENSIDRNCCD